MTENKEKSVGCIIYKTTQSGNTLFLIVHDVAHGNWGFPKGRIDSGESEQQTAIRESKEEVGLDLQIKNGFREEVQYYADSVQKHKTAVYFLAQVSEDSVIDYSISNEVDDHMWLTMYSAIGRVTFVNTALLIEKAYNFILKKD